MGRMDFDIMNEAFRAGNRARKKESVGDAAADMHNPLQDQIDRFREQTGIELEIKDGRPYYKGNCMDFPENADIPVNLFVEGDFSVSIQQERLPAGLTVTGMLDLEDCKNLTELSPNITACDLKLTHSGIKKVPNDTNITGSFIIYGEDDQDLNRFFMEDCGLRPLTVNAGSEYRPDFENRIIGFSWNRWRTVGKPDFDKIHNMLTANEAFKAGNKARKKESVQNAVELVDNIQAQMDQFKEQTGIELEFRDGRPYYKKQLDLEGCTGLTSLPQGLSVGGFMDLRGCTGLTSLPYGLTVRCNLYLEGCTGLTSLPNDLEVRGSLDLRDCTGLTSLPAGLKVRGDLTLNGCTGLISLPDGLEVGGDLNLNDCTGLTSLPKELKVREDLWLGGCIGLTSLPFDMVIQGNWIIHYGVLTSFFKKLGIPVDDEGDTRASDWSEWQKAHGYLKEAFRAGNRARKKESVQDTVESVDSLEEQVREFEKVTGAKLEIREGIPLATWLNLKDCTELTRLPDGLTVFGNLNLAGCTGLKRLPDGLTVHGYLNLHRCTGLTSLPRGMHITGSLRLSDCDGITELPADLKIEIKDIQSNSIYNVPDSLKPFLNRLGITTDIHGNVAAEDWMERRHLIGKTDEAFKAGNRARKKESVQDAVDSVDNIQARIDLFREQTGKELEIRNGRPYFDGNLDLRRCTGLTNLPIGLKVNGYLDLTCCTGLTSLPAGLEVGKSLYLGGCTGLTSLPSDLVVQGNWIAHGDILTPFFRKLGIQVAEDGDTKTSDWCKWQEAHGYLTEAFKAGNRARKKEVIADTVSIGLTPEQQIKLFMADVMKYREWLIQQGKTVEDDKVYFDENGEEENPVGVYYTDGINDVFGIDGDKVIIHSIVDFTDYPYEIHFPEKVQCNALVNLINCTGLTSLPDGMYVQDHLNLEGCSNLRRLPEDLYVGFDLYLTGCTGLESLPSNFTVNWGDLDLEDCPNIKEIPTSANLVRGHILFSPDSELHRFFIRNNIGYKTEGAGNPANPRKWHICDFSKWNAWKNGMREAFKAGNRARKKESARDNVETFEDMDFPTVMRSPVNLIEDLAGFLYRLGYKVADERELRDPHHMQNDNPIYYYSENFGNSSYGGNFIRISLGRHPVWNERLQRFISTGLILCIEATDRMYYRVQFLPADKEVEESAQFLNCSSKWFEAWEKPDGTRYGKPRNEAALTDNSIPAVWPNLFRNILTAARHPEYVFVPDKTYTKCWSFEKPSDIDEAFKAGNRARKQETAQDTVQTTGEYRPVTRELFKDVIDSIIDPEEGPISGRIYRRYDRSITGQCIVDCLNRILELCGYKDMLKAEIAFEDDTCDGVQITDDKNYSVSRMVVQYNRDYICVLTGSMDTGMPGLLYAYRNLPGILEVHLEGIDTLNADLREYIEKFG